MRRVLILIYTLFFVLLVSGCAYKPDVQQGNTFDQEMVSQLKVGMTPQQVIFIMGTPLLKDPFHNKRWDYLYTYTEGYKLPTRKLLTLYFENGLLAKIDDSQIKEIILKK